jgi:hypothetical protein
MNQNITVELLFCTIDNNLMNGIGPFIQKGEHHDTDICSGRNYS